MTRRPRLIPAFLAAVLLLLVLAASASANAFTKIFADYRADGVVTPCRFSDGDLKDAQGQIPNDIEQYAPDFPAALDEALQARARGDCAKKSKGTAAPAPVAPGTTPPSGGAGAPAGKAGTSAAPGPPGLPAAASNSTDAQVDRAAARRASDAGAPAPLIVLAVLGGLLLIAALVAAVARWRGWELARLAPARHALAEAGYRTGGLWSEFTDWVRLGR
jgi:hypothetical protein